VRPYDDGTAISKIADQKQVNRIFPHVLVNGRFRLMAASGQMWNASMAAIF